MSIRRDGTAFAVICDAGCGTTHRTQERLPVLAFYDATLRNNWRTASSIRPGRRGVYCPTCSTREAQRASDERTPA